MADRGLSSSTISTSGCNDGMAQMVSSSSPIKVYVKPGKIYKRVDSTGKGAITASVDGGDGAGRGAIELEMPGGLRSKCVVKVQGNFVPVSGDTIIGHGGVFKGFTFIDTLDADGDIKIPLSTVALHIPKSSRYKTDYRVSMTVSAASKHWNCCCTVRLVSCKVPCNEEAAIPLLPEPLSLELLRAVQGHGTEAPVVGDGSTKVIIGSREQQSTSTLNAFTVGLTDGLRTRLQSRVQPASPVPPTVRVHSPPMCLPDAGEGGLAGGHVEGAIRRCYRGEDNEIPVAIQLDVPPGTICTGAIQIYRLLESEDIDPSVSYIRRLILAMRNDKPKKAKGAGRGALPGAKRVPIECIPFPACFTTTAIPGRDDVSLLSITIRVDKALAEQLWTRAPGTPGEGGSRVCFAVYIVPTGSAPTSSSFSPPSPAHLVFLPVIRLSEKPAKDGDGAVKGDKKNVKHIQGAGAAVDEDADAVAGAGSSPANLLPPQPDTRSIGQGRRRMGKRKREESQDSQDKETMGEAQADGEEDEGAGGPMSMRRMDGSGLQVEQPTLPSTARAGRRARQASVAASVLSAGSRGSSGASILEQEDGSEEMGTFLAGTNVIDPRPGAPSLELDDMLAEDVFPPEPALPIDYPRPLSHASDGSESRTPPSSGEIDFGLGLDAMDVMMSGSLRGPGISSYPSSSTDLFLDDDNCDFSVTHGWNIS